MNPIRLLVQLLKAHGDTPAIAASHVIEAESVERQRVSEEIIRTQSRRFMGDPLRSYIWGAGKPND